MDIFVGLADNASFSCRWVVRINSLKTDRCQEHEQKNLEMLKPGGGYIFNNVHNIQVGVPAENITALFDAAYEFGFY